MDKPELTDNETLCIECGLCCQGIFHPYANLKNETDKKIANCFHAIVKEYSSLKYNVFLLPCPAFTTQCSVYPERPSVCEKHQCNLLQSLSAAEIDLKTALKVVNNIKKVVNEILPILHEYSNEYSCNKPELLMDKILEKYTNLEKKKEFKKKNIHLFSKYALFLMYRKKYFYT